jgi:hypothetical protein
MNDTRIPKLAYANTPTTIRNAGRPRKWWRYEHPWRRSNTGIAYTLCLFLLMIKRIITHQIIYIYIYIYIYKTTCTQILHIRPCNLNPRTYLMYPYILPRLRLDLISNLWNISPKSIKRYPYVCDIDMKFHVEWQSNPLGLLTTSVHFTSHLRLTSFLSSGTVTLKAKDKSVCSINQNYSWSLSPYRAANTLRFGYRNQSVNAAYGNSHCLFWDPYKTHKIHCVGRK